MRQLAEQRFLAPLFQREFRLLFSARVVSFLGSAMAPVALAFAVLDLTGSKSDLGYVLAARSLPQVVLLLAGGVWADRLPRHLVMVWSNVLSGASQAAVAALLLSGTAEIWQLAALAAVNGTSSALFFPASTGIVPQTLPMALRQQGNALLRLGINATSIGGAALGGVIVAASSPGVAIAIDAGSFLAAAAITIRMHLPRMELPRSNFVAELRDGWREFASRRWLWVIVLQFGFVNAFATAAESVLGPVVAKEHLHGAAGWGFVLSALAVGLIAGGVIMLRLQPQRILLTATLAFLLTTPLLGGLAIPLPLATIIVLAFVAGIGAETFGVMWDTAMQQEIPQETLSRVSAYDAVGSFVLIPLALAAVGPLAGALGTSKALWLAFTVNSAITLAVLCVADVRRLARRTAVATA